MPKICQAMAREGLRCSSEVCREEEEKGSWRAGGDEELDSLSPYLKLASCTVEIFAPAGALISLARNLGELGV